MLPNFFLIGAPKAGTTSLYHYLKSHPQIFLSSLKESFFFCSERYTQPEFLKEFESLFDDAASEKAVGEACAGYLFSKNACKNISNALPDAKLILILRDPAQRAYSEYLMQYRSGRVKLESRQDAMEESFLAHIEQEGSSRFYFANIQRVLQFFDKAQLKIILFEDLKNDPRAVVQDCSEFLGVNPTVKFELSSKIYNKGGMPKNTALFWVLESLRRGYRKSLAKILPAGFYAAGRSIYSKARSMNMQAKSPKLSAEGRRKLIDVHREDTLQLQAFIGRDLSAWLKV